MKIINLTPHDIKLIKDGEEIIFKTEKGLKTPRIRKVITKEETIENIPFTSYVIEEVADLPIKRPNTFYIVSSMVKNACPNRKDLIVPDTNRAIRDEKGQIIGVPAFIR